MPPDNLVLGECVGCQHPIISGEGIRVDGTGGHWHPSCREAALEAVVAPSADAPKRRGRPPKVRAVADLPPVA